MLNLENLMREVGVAADPGTRVESVLAELGADSLREMIDSLPERQRLVLALRYYEALQFQEIAAVLGARETHVSELLEKAVRGLWNKIESLGTRKSTRRAGASEGVAS